MWFIVAEVIQAVIQASSSDSLGIPGSVSKQQIPCTPFVSVRVICMNTTRAYRNYWQCDLIQGGRCRSVRCSLFENSFSRSVTPRAVLGTLLHSCWHFHNFQVEFITITSGLINNTFTHTTDTFNRKVKPCQCLIRNHNMKACVVWRCSSTHS
jgi:hypothetical protein